MLKLKIWRHKMLEQILIGGVYFLIIVSSIWAVLKEEAESNEKGRKK